MQRLIDIQILFSRYIHVIRVYLLLKDCITLLYKKKMFHFVYLERLVLPKIK